ncbi:MAG: ATP-binding protein [Microbacteriaceae bacterium]|nr:ATP-binding protein [Microbacteriaceae bacterium]
MCYNLGMSYLERTVDAELDYLLSDLAAVAIDGPKGVGKSYTARRRSDTEWRLDDPAQLEIARSDFWLKTVPEGTLLIDEWQYLPQVWDSVRRQVDFGAPPGRFILTGSATPVNAAGTHSGAGRIVSLRMRPMALHERGIVTPTISFEKVLNGTAGDILGTSSFSLADYAAAIASSGFPAIMKASPRSRKAMLDAYLARVIDRDLPDQGYDVRRPEILRRWMSAYAAASSTNAAYSTLLDATTGGDGSQPAKETTIAYREHLSRLWLVDPVHGWLAANNPIKRLMQAPKHQLADPALAARLLSLTETSLVSSAGAHMFGPLFESLATLTVRVCAQLAQARVNHMRIQGGDREIDLIVTGPEGQILAIEVKMAASIDDRDVRHLLWLRDQIPDKVVDLVVLNTGPGAYRRPDGVVVIPLAMLGA